MLLQQKRFVHLAVNEKIKRNILQTLNPTVRQKIRLIVWNGSHHGYFIELAWSNGMRVKKTHVPELSEPITCLAQGFEPKMTSYEQCEPWIIVHVEDPSMRASPRWRMEQTESFNGLACLIRQWDFTNVAIWAWSQWADVSLRLYERTFRATKKIVIKREKLMTSEHIIAYAPQTRVCIWRHVCPFLSWGVWFDVHD